MNRPVRTILNNLLMTAYFSKKFMLDEEEFGPFEKFFYHNFPKFAGKFSEWHLLEEPDAQTIKFSKINKQYNELSRSYNGEDANRLFDFNHEVDLLEEEHMKKDIMTLQTFTEKDRSNKKRKVPETRKEEDF